jgi:hypothetical protein
VVSGNKRLDSGADVAQAEGAAVTRKAAGIVRPCQNDALQRVQGDLKILWAPSLARAALKDRAADAARSACFAIYEIYDRFLLDFSKSVIKSNQYTASLNSGTPIELPLHLCS